MSIFNGRPSLRKQMRWEHQENMAKYSNPNYFNPSNQSFFNQQVAYPMDQMQSPFLNLLNKPTQNPYDMMYKNAIKPYSQIMAEGGMMMPEEQEQESQEGGQEDQMMQIMQQVAQMLQQGADPQEVMQQLVQMGIPEDQAQQIIQQVMSQMQGGQPQMRLGGQYAKKIQPYQL